MTERPAFDGLRVGLSFSEETALLIGLRRGRLAPAALPPWSRLITVQNQVQALSRAKIDALTASLAEDLELSPITIEPHPEFASAIMADLPTSLHKSPPGDSVSPWIRARIPTVSGRIRRSEFELNTLLTLERATRRAIMQRTVRLALRVVLDGLSERRKLVLLSSLPIEHEVEVLDVPASISDNIELLEGLREGLARASAGGRDVPHVMDRLAVYLLAMALLGTHHCELRAFAALLSVRRARRLTRFFRDILPGRTGEVLGTRELFALAYHRERGGEVPNG